MPSIWGFLIPFINILADVFKLDSCHFIIARSAPEVTKFLSLFAGFLSCYSRVSNCWGREGAGWGWYTKSQDWAPTWLKKHTHLVTGFAVSHSPQWKGWGKRTAAETSLVVAAESGGGKFFWGVAWNNHGSKTQRGKEWSHIIRRYLSPASLTHITGNPWCLRWTPTMKIPGVPLRCLWVKGMEQTPGDGVWHTQ